MSCLAPMGRLDEALDEMLLAQSLDPVSSIIVRDVAVILLTIKVDPRFDALKDDRRFESVVRQMGLES